MTEELAVSPWDETQQGDSARAGEPPVLAVSYTHLDVYKRQGFNSSTHFNIVFKKIMRCTPAEYRNGLKQ